MTLRRQPGWLVMVVAALCTLLGIALDPVRAVRFAWMWAFFVGGRFASSHTLAVREFLQVRPMSGRQPFLAVMLPWLLVVLINPALGLARVLSAESLPSEDVTLVAPGDQGAVTGNAARQMDAERVVMSPPLRRLLALDLLRSALLQLAMFFAMGALGVTGKPGPRWNRTDTLKALLILPLLGLGLFFIMPWSWLKIPVVPPPLWLAAVLAVSAAAALRHQLILPRGSHRRASSSPSAQR